MPLVEIWGVGFTAEDRSKLQRSIASAIKEVMPLLKDHEELIWVVFHEVPAENWMIGPLNVKELRQKLMAEKK